jgi:hypothetical protein
MASTNVSSSGQTVDWEATDKIVISVNQALVEVSYSIPFCAFDNTDKGQRNASLTSHLGI